MNTLAQTSGSAWDSLAGPNPNGKIQWVAQEFVPQFGATLDSVTLRLVWTPPFTDLVSPVVELWAGSPTAPSTLVGTLISPAVSMSMYVTTSVTFDGNHLALAANTPYWIVLESPVSTFSWRSLSPTVVCDAAKCGSAFAATSSVSIDGGLNWLSNLDVNKSAMTARMQVDVTGVSDVPEPATAWLLLPLGALPLFLRRRST